MNNNSIKSQLDANAKSLEWGRVYLRGQELADFRSTLITNRIKLKRLLYASSVNPAAAIFGESQVGKSYMVDCLLTSQTEVLNIYDGKSQPTGFLESINPLGGGKEATSLISRFTAKQVWADADYPIRATMLTPIDIVIVLLDAYYNDVINHDFPKADKVKEEIDRLKKRYQTSMSMQDTITEDEIFELKEYLTSNLVSRGEAFRQALVETRYFESLALLISNISVEQWADVFEFLWNKNNILTDVFHKLIATLKRMDFSHTVYIKMDAVLRKYGTILHVDRLYELFGISEVVNDKGNKCSIEAASEPSMSVMTEKGNKLAGIPKSEFCVLAMELAFTIVDIKKENKEFFKDKPFLKNSDILDFPGARSRKMIQEEIISETDACEMILRGKVAYLFNKYSQQYLITNLLFCHHDVKSEVVTLSSLLKGWVENTVGKTAEQREKFMQIAEISPLFLIGTKFNIDLSKIPDDSKGDEESRKKVRDYRWSKRFQMLENLIAPAANNTWLNEWTPNKPFNNIYLLRSFEYSCQNGLFEGYQKKDDNDLWHLVYKDDGKLQGEQKVGEEYKVFLPLLRESFLENAFVKQHFADPGNSWDEAATVGKDGSAWIIKNLSRSSEKMSVSRDAQFEMICKETFESLVNALISLYHDDNSDLELKKQIQTAGAISFTFDVLFGRDKYFFSDFISKMVIDEESLHDVVLDMINNMKVVNETDLSELFAIRARANVDVSLTFDENKNRIMRAYNIETYEDLDRWLNERNLKLEDIITTPNVMNFSRMISDAVERKWVDANLSLDHYQDFIRRGLKEKELKQFLENSKVLYCEKLKLSDKIANKLYPYVSSSNSVDDMSDMLADICAEMINRFVNTMGSAYYDDEMWNNVKSTIEHNGFDIKLQPELFGTIEFNEEKVRESLPEVFDTFENVDKILNEVPVDKNKLKYFSNYQEYYKWTELMKISFLATQGIPKYDIAMNNALRTLIDTYIIQKDDMKTFVEKNGKLKNLHTIKADESK
ncbi:MAG: putative virulence factor [Prevotella sp.]|nr:putative virulence factor [Prevotella sp.]